jgi:hypothetical protein
MDAFMGGGIPIYWGDPKITEDFNEKAFINITVLKGKYIDAMQIIKDLHENSNKYEDVYKQPIFTEQQQLKLLDNLDEFEHWFVRKIRS